MPILSSLPAKILLRIIDNCAVETVGRLGLVNRKFAVLTKQKLRVTPHQRLSRRRHRHTSQGIKCREDVQRMTKSQTTLPNLSSNLFSMTNLRPKRTGLPFVVYVSFKGNSAPGPRIKASNKYGEKASEGDWFTITIDDQPQVIGESTGLKRGDVQMAKKWVQINKDELLKIWEDEVDVFEADLQQV